MIDFSIERNFLPEDAFKNFRSKLLKLNYRRMDYGNLGYRYCASLGKQFYSASFFGVHSTLLAPRHFDAVKMGYGDRLNWHNDCGRRRVLAMTYFWHPEWKPDWGGELILGRKNSVVIRPWPNTLVVMRVSENSWHKVNSVRSEEFRCSVTGWFALV